MLSSENNDNPLRRQQRAERKKWSDRWVQLGSWKEWLGTAEVRGGTLAQSVGWLPSHTVVRWKSSTHFGRVIVMQESRILPQDKAPHLPVFPLVPLTQRKGSRLIRDSPDASSHFLAFTAQANLPQGTAFWTESAGDLRIAMTWTSLPRDTWARTLSQLVDRTRKGQHWRDRGALSRPQSGCKEDREAAGVYWTKSSQANWNLRAPAFKCQKQTYSFTEICAHMDTKIHFSILHQKKEEMINHMLKILMYKILMWGLFLASPPRSCFLSPQAWSPQSPSHPLSLAGQALAPSPH